MIPKSFPPYISKSNAAFGDFFNLECDVDVPLDPKNKKIDSPKGNNVQTDEGDEIHGKPTT